jgi:MFS family permease
LWSSPLAPFKVRSFRFQWPADLLMAWAWDMESLILAWFVLVETESVLFLTLFGALQFVGTLIAPFTGVLGDRWGRRNTLCLIRGFMAAMASIILIMAFAGVLRPAYVLPMAFLTGLVRPSDLSMRNALIGDTMAPGLLMGALGLSRMTQDSSRIMGALIGAGLMTALGIGPAYVVVITFYLASLALTRQVSHVPAADAPPPDAAPLGMMAQQWKDLREGLSYAWATPTLVGLMLLACLLNFSAFPLSHHLMPYVAKEIYHQDAQGLAHLVATFACGALIGSLFMTVMAGERSARFMLVSVVGWYAIIGVFAWLDDKPLGMAVLFVMGFVHNLAMVSLSGVLLRGVAARFRARVMGIRTLVVYGLPIGLLLAGYGIEHIGYPLTATAYVVFSIAVTAVIGRRYLWRP